MTTTFLECRSRSTPATAFGAAGRPCRRRERHSRAGEPGRPVLTARRRGATAPNGGEHA